MLEFDQLRQLLAGYTASPLGTRAGHAAHALAGPAWIERQQQLTEELRGYLRTGGSFDFHGLLDPTPADQQVAHPRRGAGAERDPRPAAAGRPRRRVARDRAASHGASRRRTGRQCIELSQSIADFTPLLRYFGNKILPDGTLDDRASPELARIRREIEKQKRTIQESLRSYLRRLSEGGAVQDELVTIRGDRFVIPVKVEQRRRVQGVAHGASSSGQTVFIEPLETIEQNNELVRLLEDEQAEIHRILLEMTARLGEHADALAACGGDS